MSGECMEFPQTFEEFAERYKIMDTEKAYTNGVDLIPIFRVEQWLNHFREVTKNDVSDKNVGDIDKFIDGLVEIFANIREKKVDDSVCGLCEYDGAYIGESGDWCNECPGFDRDDCFKLKEELRKKWMDEILAICRNFGNSSEIPNGQDLISRQAAIDALDVLCQEHRYKIPGKRETYSQYNEAWQDALDRAEGAIFNLPSAQPEPLSDVYIKAVWTWLINYQIKAAELKGRYTPYEVLSWVVNDWRKEHE